MDAETERLRGDRLAQQCQTCLDMQRVCLDMLAAEKAESARLRGELAKAEADVDSVLEGNALLGRRVLELEEAAARAERGQAWPPPVSYGPAVEQILEAM